MPFKKDLNKDCVSFMPANIRIGKSVAFFLFNRGFSRVILIYDYQNKSLIIEGMTPEKIKTYEYPIINSIGVSSLRSYRVRTQDYIWKFLIESKGHRSLLDFTRRDLIFKAKPISNNQILVENLPMTDNFKFSLNTFIMDPKNSKIIFHSPVNYERVNGVSIKRGEITMSERFVERARQKRLQHQPNRININQNEVKKFQPNLAARPNDIVNKEIGNIWGFEKPVAKLPSTEQRLEADKAYSKMILGE
jgi:hypothetical protein